MKKKPIAISVVSPIYNDMRSMPRVLPELIRLLGSTRRSFEIVLVDDASYDGSRAWVAKFAAGKSYIRVLYHAKNEGIAHTYRELYRHARGNIVVLFSLDGEWDTRDALRLIEAIIKRNDDIVIGVRRKKQYTIWRGIVSYWYNLMTRRVFGVLTYDAGSIKAFRQNILTSIQIVSTGVFDEAERLIRADRNGYTISTISVSHRKKEKERRGIRFMHVIEACIDMMRVYRSIHTT